MLVNLMDQHNLALLNEPDTPTSMGTSTSRDTTPDLTLLSGTLDVSWRNTGVNLGSDHDILNITIRGPMFKARMGTAKLTDWDKLRQRQAADEDENMNSTRPYGEWAKEQIELVAKYTQKIATTLQTPFVDARLAHFWEARHSLTRRWKKQRHNRKLRRRIHELNKQAAEYATQLCKENWLSVCDGLQGTLSTRKTWSLLRHLIDPLSSKSATNRSLIRTLNNYTGGVDELINDLKAKYLKTEKGDIAPQDYAGPTNEAIDKPFTDTELVAAISESNKASAPGPDTITYKLLNNLGDKARRELLQYTNQVWETGKLPPEWKEAEVRFIPKPGKTPHIDNMRPISLTSCVGKIMERPSLCGRDLIALLDTTGVPIGGLTAPDPTTSAKPSEYMLNRLVGEFEDVFSTGLGIIKGPPVSLKLRDGDTEIL
ncbi:uncharacterized protein LOC144168388 [Haemaphysalis longicornis]